MPDAHRIRCQVSLWGSSSVSAYVSPHQTQLTSKVMMLNLLSHHTYVLHKADCCDLSPLLEMLMSLLIWYNWHQSSPCTGDLHCCKAYIFAGPWLLLIMGFWWLLHQIRCPQDWKKGRAIAASHLYFVQSSQLMVTAVF